MTVRNLVLLSDGTGNSAAKITKTNVWRIFQAIDLSDNNQLAFYDDGVGTGGFRLLRTLGGAFGFGLARNVRQLYEELCRHYSGRDDRIFLFGFSRGAFTIRVLSGLIEHCGVIDRNSNKEIEIWSWTKLRRVKLSLATDEGLKSAVRVGYRAMRKRNARAPVTRLFRRIRDAILDTPDVNEFRKNFSVSPRPDIEFIGVFDTVSAYGLPIDEMAIAIHKWIWPLRFPRMILSRKVNNACQALALDEARHTFHPVLWTEREYSKDGQGDPDPRPHQVWFPGMHADVGGGYANDRLSFVPLLWMLGEARTRSGLRLRDDAYTDHAQWASEHGEIHDSRRGLAAFYRYKPRMLERLGNEDLDGNGYPEVRIDRFKIHEATLQRIRQSGADYAPVGIPEDYDVVRPKRDPNGNVVLEASGDPAYETVSADVAGYEDAGQRNSRRQAQRGIEDLIFWRRVFYYAMTAIAGVMVVLPLIWLPNRAVIADGFGMTIVGGLAFVFDYLPLPRTEQIGLFWTQHAVWFLLLVAGFIVTYLVSGAISRAMQARAEAAWAHVAGGTTTTKVPRKQWIETWRGSTGGFHQYWTKNAFPLVMVLLLFLVLPSIVVWRYVLFNQLGQNSVCAHVHAAAGQVRDRPLGESVAFSTDDPCTSSGFNLMQGREYSITIELGEAWRDHRFTASPSGLAWSELSWGTRIKMASLSLARRFWTEDWFAMMGSIGRSRDHVFRIEAKADNAGTYSFRFYAWRTGRLYLFVNDAINAFDSDRFCSPKDGFEERDPWKCYYANNQGSAMVTVREVAER